MTVEIRWREIGRDADLAWRYSRVLYAYLDPSGKEILYIGKADGTTVRQRWTRSAKEGFWDDLERELGILEHLVFVGEPFLGAGTRLTRDLLADIESLLINRIKPWGNVASRRSRISRPGLVVRCLGDWLHPRRVFRDR